MIKRLLKDRKLILELSINDFRRRFSGSYFGVFWAFVQPIINVSIYWFIFGSGLKSGPAGDVPFLLWLLAGICPWFFINDSINNTANCFVEYGYIIKKVKFNTSYVPVIKMISSFFVHIFFIWIVFLVFILSDYRITIYAVQIIYYLIYTLLFAVALTYFNASISVFFRDFVQIVSILMQYSMWCVPIMISEDNFPGAMKGILKFNPLYYIVQGYRDAFINRVWFWERFISQSKMCAYYWIVVLVMLTVSAYTYKKLKVSFMDVL